jgi:hypothetical protein
VQNLTIEAVQEHLKRTNLSFSASQTKVSFPILYRIHRRLQEGKRFDPIKVADGTIMNGHHRFICLSILGIDVEWEKGTKNLTATQNVSWSEMIIDHGDHDSDEKRENYRKMYDSEQVTQDK